RGQHDEGRRQRLGLVARPQGRDAAGDLGPSRLELQRCPAAVPGRMGRAVARARDRGAADRHESSADRYPVRDRRPAHRRAAAPAGDRPRRRVELMVNYHQLASARPGLWSSAADDWTSLGKDLTGAADDLAAEARGPIPVGWSSPAGQAARRRLQIMWFTLQAGSVVTSAVAHVLL